MSLDICYSFTAMSCASGVVSLRVNVCGVSSDALTSEQIDILWRDVVACFVSAGFFRVSALLSSLPYDWNSAGTFVVEGTSEQRKQVFDLLARNSNDDHEPEHPHSVSMEFYLSRNPPQLTIHAHHKAVFSWRVDQIAPSVVFDFQTERAIAC